MNVEYFKTLYDYHYWARDRLLAAADGMTDEEYQKPNGFTYNGLHLILAHTLSAEHVWLTRFRGEALGDGISESGVATLATLKAQWAVEEGKMREFLGSLTEAGLSKDLVFRLRSGQERRAPVWLLLAQVANHGTQHRSEAAEALTMVGRSPGSLDLITMYWQA